MPGLTKVFVGNLAFTTKEPELAQEFAAAGKVLNANIITRGPRSLGYGFVEFDNEQDAQNAVKVMDKKEIQGRQVNVELARPQDEIKKEEQQADQSQSQKTRGSTRGGRGAFRGRGASSRGRGRRTFRRRDQGGEEGEEGQKAQTSTQQGGKAEKPTNDVAKEPKKPKQPRERKPTEGREESQTTLFVANLPFGLDDAGFGKFIADLGLKFKTAHVVTKRNGRSKGYGFVEFDQHDDQQKALQVIDKKEVEGRPLSVKVALTEPKTEGEEKKEEKKEDKPATKETKPATKEVKKEDKPAAKETKKEDKPATKEDKPAAKETKKEEKKDTKPAQKETKAPAKETKSPQPQKK